MPDSPSALLDVLLAEINAYRQTSRPVHLAHAARLLRELQTAALPRGHIRADRSAS
jgi:hypothetical protein